MSLHLEVILKYSLVIIIFYVLLRTEMRPDKGRNMMCEGYKSKNGTQHGYFEDEFKRLFVGECLPGRGRKPYA